MPGQFPQKFRSALCIEIRSWLQEGLISGETGEALLTRYPVQASEQRMIAVMLVLGAILVGLGALLFIGANWHLIPAVWKLPIILAAVIGAHAAGWRCAYEPGTRPRLGAAFMLLGSLLYGAGIWLVAQIFNLEANFGAGMMMWALGTMAVATVTRSGPLSILSAVLSTVWCLNDGLSGSSSPFGGSPEPSLMGMGRFAGAMLFNLLVSYNARSKWAVAVLFAGGALFVACASGTGCLGLVLYGAMLLSGFLWHRYNWQLFEGSYLYVGAISTLLGLLLLTGDRYGAFAHNLSLPNLVALLAAALAGFAVMSTGHKKWPPEVLGGMVLSLLSCVAVFAGNDAGRLLMVNSVLLGSIISLVMLGLKKFQSPGMVNVAVVFFVLDMVWRYFDVFFSMMDRSIFFIAGGAMLLVTGAVTEQGRRKLLERLGQ